MVNKEKTELFPNVTWYLDPDFNKLKQVVSPKHLPQFLCEVFGSRCVFISQSFNFLRDGHLTSLISLG